MDPDNEDTKAFIDVMLYYLAIISGIGLCFFTYLGIRHAYYFYAAPIVVVALYLSLLVWMTRRKDNNDHSSTLNITFIAQFWLLGLPHSIGFTVMSSMDNLDFEAIRSANIGIFNFIESLLRYSWEDIATLNRPESLQCYFAVIVSIYHTICIFVASTLLFPTIGRSIIQTKDIKIRPYVVLLMMVVTYGGFHMLISTINDWNFYYRFRNPEYKYWFRTHYRGTGVMIALIPVLLYFTLSTLCAFVVQRCSKQTHDSSDKIS